MQLGTLLACKGVSFTWHNSIWFLFHGQITYAAFFFLTRTNTFVVSTGIKKKN